jgi:hypothetical protein
LGSTEMNSLGAVFGAATSFAENVTNSFDC